MHSLFEGTPLGDAWIHVVTKSQPSLQAPREAECTTTDTEKVASTIGVTELWDEDELSYLDPKRWSLLKKTRVVAIIAFYTFAVYAGSAIYIASLEMVLYEYMTSIHTALLGLSLYVLGYGIGPLLWAPLSEVPWIGRNPVYTLTTIIFLVVSIITAVAKSLPFFLFLRFVQGFFGSPCLANGGASLHDIFEGHHLPIAQTIWVAGAYGGPAIGPVMASYLVEHHGWRISMWEIVVCAVVALVMLLLLPETYLPKILHQHRKQRPLPARPSFAKQGQVSSKSSSPTPFTSGNTEEDRQKASIGATILDALVKPIQISCRDPAIAYVNIYTSYLYSCYYTFFDGFPMVYRITYRFTASQIGLVFLPILVGCAIAILLYCFYILRFTTKTVSCNPEARLRPALVAVWAVPLGIVLFGWTAEASSNAHWAWGMLGLVRYSGAVFIILQCIIMYILDSYPRYAASLFAANDFSRSALAAAAIHFGVPLYMDLGPGKACSILGATSALGIGGMYLLYWRGEQLRAKSRFTG